MTTLDKIFQTMKSKSIKNLDLAKHLDISVFQISNWKSGNNQSYLKYISGIADYLEVSADYLLGTEKAASPQYSEDTAEAIELFNSMCKEDQKWFIKMMKSRLENDE